MNSTERDAVLLPCPFCGAPAESEPWHGGSPTKIMISCNNDYCDVSPAVTGETPNKAALRWNKRYKEKELETVKSERDSYWMILELISERFPDCQAIGDLPGCVDELKREILRLAGVKP